MSTCVGIGHEWVGDECVRCGTTERDLITWPPTAAPPEITASVLGCSCLPPPATWGPEADCPVHGAATKEPE